jgi:hypothetical protein
MAMPGNEWSGQILCVMKKDKKETNESSSLQEKQENFTDYPVYPSSEDIYNKFKEEHSDAEKKIREHYEKFGRLNEKDFIEDMTGSDTDDPDSETEDEQDRTSE